MLFNAIQKAAGFYLSDGGIQEGEASSTSAAYNQFKNFTSLGIFFKKKKKRKTKLKRAFYN